jgi:hypothetical protein
MISIYTKDYSGKNGPNLPDFEGEKKMQFARFV